MEEVEDETTEISLKKRRLDANYTLNDIRTGSHSRILANRPNRQVVIQRFRKLSVP